MLSTYKPSDLLYELRRQYGTGIVTMGPCASGCESSARGSGFCRDCLVKEMRRRGVTRTPELLYLLNQQQELAAKIYELTELIQEQMEGVK